MPEELFRATTLVPGKWNLHECTLTRNRIVDLLDHNSVPRSLGWLVGPMGSGKTTVALQWAKMQNVEVQYVSVRRLSSRLQADPQEPNELGAALRDLLNICSDDPEAIDANLILESTERVLDITRSNQLPFILDDLEFLEREATNVLQENFASVLPRLRTQRALFSSRAIDANLLGAIQSARPVRVILPSTLAFDTSETEEARKLGVFGTASPAEIERAHDRSSGWITGMLADLDGNGGLTLSRPEFNATVLNDMLLLQPPPILRCLNASAMLPFTTTEIWELWFDEIDWPHWAIAPTFTQIATRNAPEPHRKMEIAPPLQEAILRLSPLSITDEIVQALILIAMKWYVSNDFVESAISVAKTYKLQKEYVALIKPIAEEHARNENWSAIKQLVNGLPEDLVHSDGDLHFWMEFALAAELAVSDFLNLHQRYGAGREHSRNPLERGRHKLIQGFIARGTGELQSSFEHFEDAFNSLPPTAHQERLYAAASAGNAASHINIDSNHADWSNKVAFELSHLPARQRWFHSDAGPVGLGFIASAGQMSHSYNLVRRQIEGLLKHSPEHTWRYFLNLTCIDIERRDFDSAAEALESARPNILNELQNGLLQIVEARLHLAMGDHATAKEVLVHPSSPQRDAMSGGIRYMAVEAQVALETGDPETAKLILGMSAWPKDHFPRNFGDPHPAHILALAQSETRLEAEALGLVQDILDESRKRGNRHLEVHSLAILTHIHDHLGNHNERDQALQQALHINAKVGFENAFFVLGHDIRDLSSQESVVDRYNASERLTSREIEVLRLVSESLSNKQIANTMYISISTVKNHLASVFMKLGASNRRDAVVIARGQKII